MKILVIRFSSIGDIVLTTPVVRCLKKQLENVEIHYITKAIYGSILESNPYIDHLHLMEGTEIKNVVKSFKTSNFDYIIDLHHNLRSMRVKRKLNGKPLSFYKANIEKWLMVNFKADFLPDKHIVDRYMDTVRSLNVINDGKGLDYFIPEKDKISLSEVHHDLRPGYIAIVIGAKYNTKRMPSDKLKRICQDLQNDIVLIGGKEDSAYGENIRSSRERIYNCCGRLSINQSADVIGNSSLVISNDTGMMHIAAAFDKNMISLWGNTIPEFGMYPYYRKESKALHEVVQNNELACRPCSKIGYSKCPKDHFRCMRDLDEDYIVSLVRKATVRS